MFSTLEPPTLPSALYPRPYNSLTGTEHTFLPRSNGCYDYDACITYYAPVEDHRQSEYLYTILSMWNWDVSNFLSLSSFPNPTPV
jgi:hypothetical protein